MCVCVWMEFMEVYTHPHTHPHTCTHTYTHMHKHTHIHTHIHTHMHTHTQVPYAGTCLPKLISECTCANSHRNCYKNGLLLCIPYTYVHTLQIIYKCHTLVHTPSHTHTHTYPHPCKPTHTHTLTHTHIQAQH